MKEKKGYKLDKKKIIMQIMIKLNHLDADECMLAFYKVNDIHKAHLEKMINKNKK